MSKCTDCGKEGQGYSTHIGSGKILRLCPSCTDKFNKFGSYRGLVKKSLSKRIDNFIEKQISLKTYFCKICGQRHKLNSSLGQKHYVENFSMKMEKQETGSPIRFKNAAEARSAGIKLPPEFDEPKTPKIPNVNKPKKPKTSTGDKVGKVIGEAGHQLSPLGPGYHSPRDIVQDVQEARRASRGIKGLFNKE